MQKKLRALLSSICHRPRMHVSFFWIQDTGSRIQNTEYRIQNTECRMQNTAYRMQNTDYRMQRRMQQSSFPTVIKSPTDQVNHDYMAIPSLPSSHTGFIVATCCPFFISSFVTWISVVRVILLSLIEPSAPLPVPGSLRYSSVS